MRHSVRGLVCTSKEEFLILSQLNIKKNLVGIIAAMVQIRLRDAGGDTSGKFQQYLDDVGVFALSSKGYISNHVSQWNWTELVADKTQQIEGLSQLGKLMDFAGFPPVVILSDKCLFPAHYPRLFIEFFEFSGVQLSFIRKTI